jgi:uncharacterized protein with HEPN domain
MKRQAKTCLFDVQAAGQRLQRFASGKTLDQYLGDELLRAGVERQFEIIGEALTRLTKLFPDVAARITDCRRIVNFRNLLIHGYDQIHDDLVWVIIERDLTVLLDEVQALLAEPDEA